VDLGIERDTAPLGPAARVVWNPTSGLGVPLTVTVGEPAVGFPAAMVVEEFEVAIVNWLETAKF